MRSRSIALGASVLLLLAGTVPAYATDQRIWLKSYSANAPCGLTPQSSAVDASSGTVYTLYEEFNCGPYGMLLTAYSPSGTRKWVVADPADDVPAGVVVDPASHTVLVAATRNGNELYAAAYDTSGHQKWDRGYTATGAEFRTAGLAVDGAGRVLVTGTVTRSGVPAISTAAFKISTGATVWHLHYAGSADAIAGGIAADPTNHRVYILGTQSSGSGADLLTVAYGSGSGNVLWSKDDRSVSARPVSIQVDPGNHQVYDIVGSLQMAGAFVYAYTSSGTLTWHKVYDLEGGMVPTAGAVDTGNHQVYAVGNDGTAVHATLVAWSSSGTQKWVDADTSVGQAIPLALAADPTSHRVYVTSSAEPANGTERTVTFADSATGTRAWHDVYSLPGNRSPEPGSLSVDPARTQVYAGVSAADANGSTNDAVVIAYHG